MRFLLSPPPDTASDLYHSGIAEIRFYPGPNIWSNIRPRSKPTDELCNDRLLPLIW